MIPAAAELARHTANVSRHTSSRSILTPAHRGHGYGPHLSALLAQALPDRTRLLTGTIHAANTGARRAALTAGRQDIGGCIQLPLGGVK